MASIKRFPGKEEKASSLDSLFSTRPRADTDGDAGNKRKKFAASLEDSKGKAKKLAWLVDIIVLLVIAGVVTAIYFHVIRPMLRNYDDIWDSRLMVCTIELPDLDPSLVVYDRDGTLSVKGRDIFVSPSEQADRVGTVTDCETVVSLREDGSETVTLRLTVESTLRYRTGEGYFAGETRLLCGETRTFRLWGLSADGDILTMSEKEE